MSRRKKIYDIYLLGAVSGEDGPKTKNERAKLCDLLIEREHNVISTHVGYDYEQTTFRERVGGLQGIYPANMGFMNDANLFVAEASGTSEGRGIEIAYGLFVREVPVLLFRAESWGRSTNMIAGNTHPLLNFQFYTPENLEEKVDHVIANIPNMLKEFKIWKKTHRGRHVWLP